MFTVLLLIFIMDELVNGGQRGHKTSVLKPLLEASTKKCIITTQKNKRNDVQTMQNSHTQKLQ